MMLPFLLGTVLAATVIVPAGAVPCRDKSGVQSSTLQISPQGPAATTASLQGPFESAAPREKGEDEKSGKSVVLQVSTTTMSAGVEQATQKTKCDQKGDKKKAKTQETGHNGDDEQPTGSMTEPRTKPSQALSAPVSDKTGDKTVDDKPLTPPKPEPVASAKPKLPTQAPDAKAEEPKKPEASNKTPASTQDDAPKNSPPSKSSGLSGSASITPHDKYSSSIGVLGCKMNIDRVAYWPGAVNCNDICVEVSHEGRSLKLLKIDGSTGAHDISYDAWNYLAFGKGAKQEPHAGGGIDMEYKYVPAEECADLFENGRMALSAANSMNYYASCKAETSSWVANHMDLWNFQDARCTFGTNEQCEVDLTKENIPRCASGIGSSKASGMEVKDIPYMG